MDTNYYFPQYLSTPLKFVGLDSDTGFILVLFLMLAMMFGGWWFSLVVIGPMAYANIKRKTSSSFLIHSMYFSGFKKFKNYPLFFENTFQE